jgi:hypothetical protein
MSAVASFLPGKLAGAVMGEAERMANDDPSLPAAARAVWSGRLRIWAGWRSHSSRLPSREDKSVRRSAPALPEPVLGVGRAIRARHDCRIDPRRRTCTPGGPTRQVDRDQRPRARGCSPAARRASKSRQARKRAWQTMSAFGVSGHTDRKQRSGLDPLPPSAIQCSCVMVFLFDQLVRAQQDRYRHIEAKRLGGDLVFRSNFARRSAAISLAKA